MRKKRHFLANLWESYPEALTNTHNSITGKEISHYIASIISMGPFYYYVIQISDYSVHQFSESVLAIHGLNEYPTTLQQIIDHIHPDDLDFVLAAEAATLEKMREIGFEHQLQLKSSYCFRMKVADGSYHLFHHQAIHLEKNRDGRLISALNIHTDIQHITQKNSKIVLVNGIGNRNDYCQIDLSSSSAPHSSPQLSKREMDVLNLLAKGLSSQQIGKQLFISETTVRVHRKHLLKKMNVTNSSSLIKRCIETGLL